MAPRLPGDRHCTEPCWNLFTKNTGRSFPNWKQKGMELNVRPYRVIWGKLLLSPRFSSLEDNHMINYLNRDTGGMNGTLLNYARIMVLTGT